jgi:hypothetical protein
MSLLDTTPTSRRGGPLRPIVVALSIALLAMGLSACLPVAPPPPTAVTTNPPLFPTFEAGVRNYVVRCTPGTPTKVHVTAPSSALVSVAQRYPLNGTFDESVPQQVGERFTIAVTTDVANNVTTTYNVRCLPADFTDWSVTRSSYGVTPYFMTAPLAGGRSSYTAIYDRNGVPLWWGEPSTTIFSTLLPDGHVGSLFPSGLQETTLDGAFVRKISTVGGPVDTHDVLLLANGHVVLVTLEPLTGIDLTAIGGPANASMCDHVVQEIDPGDGSVVWSWRTSEHIPVTEMDPQWESSYITPGPTDPTCGYDVYHWNSIEATGTGFVLSFRHLDALYDIDRASGSVVWKLGGSSRPESLKVVGDPVFSGGSHFGGQHDGRVLPDGSVTLYDDGTALGRAPRAVRYAIDTNAKTATLLDSVSDPEVPGSFCCGSARYLGSTVWAVGWGGTGNATETVGGGRQFALSFPGSLVYRLIPLTTSQVSVDQLVSAMDAKFASAGTAAAPDPGGVTPFPP